MRAAFLTGLKKIEVRETEKSDLLDDEALVRVKAVGVCGSDVHLYQHGKIGNVIVKYPHICGHEAAGEVIGIGKNVKKFKTGDRVAIEPGIPCGICEFCLSGRYNICPDIKFLGLPPVSGAYREFISYPAAFLHGIPDSMSFETAAIAETMAVGLYSAELSELKAGDSIAILGAGPVGLVTLKAAKLSGAIKIFITDLIDSRLNIAGKYKNVTVINAGQKNPVEEIRKLTNGRGVDIVFEAAGALDSIRQSIEIARIGGKVIWIGIPAEDYVMVDSHVARRKELVIRSVRRFRHNYMRCIELLKNSSVSLDDIITDKFGLDDIKTAFELVAGYSKGVMKAVINI